MKDPFEVKKEEGQWSDEQIKQVTEGTPEKLLNMLDIYLGGMRDRCRAYRTDMLLKKELVDPAWYQLVLIEWGVWSNQFNAIIRFRIKNSDADFEEIENQMISKKLSTLFLYWCKCNDAFNLLATPFPGNNIFKLATAFESVKTVKDYFNNIKLEDYQNG